MTDARSQVIATFVEDAGWGGAQQCVLAGDASARRYLRLHRSGETAVLMDAPPQEGEDIGPFVRMTHWLRALKLTAPAVLAEEPNQGLLLLEDLGDDLFAHVAPQSESSERLMYSEAVRLLVLLRQATPPDWIMPYDSSVLTREAALFTDWWLPATGVMANADDLCGLIKDVTRDVAQTRDVMVLRDYHAENLLWLPDRHDVARVGLLDYQDALVGHPAYDLMSLLEDARRDTSEELQHEMMALYLRECPDLDRDAFLAAFSALGAQRNMKIIGIFTRLAIRDGKPRYLSLIPRVWGHLQRDLSHERLAPLRDWVNAVSPEPTDRVLTSIAKGVAT